MTISQHWLVEAAQHGRPDVVVASNVAIAPNLNDAWAQVCGLFHISAPELTAMVAQSYSLEPGNLKRFQPGEGSCLPERLCRDLHLVPMWAERDLACIAVSDPRLTQDQRKQLSFAAKRQIEVVVLAPEEIDTCQTRLFSMAFRGGNIKTQVIDLLAQGSLASDSNTVKLAGAILRNAIDRNACAPCKGGAFLWVQVPPGQGSSQ